MQLYVARTCSHVRALASEVVRASCPYDNVTMLFGSTDKFAIEIVIDESIHPVGDWAYAYYWVKGVRLNVAKGGSDSLSDYDNRFVGIDSDDISETSRRLFELESASKIAIAVFECVYGRNWRHSMEKYNMPTYPNLNVLIPNGIPMFDVGFAVRVESGDRTLVVGIMPEDDELLFGENNFDSVRFVSCEMSTREFKDIFERALRWVRDRTG